MPDVVSVLPASTTGGPSNLVRVDLPTQSSPATRTTTTASTGPTQAFNLQTELDDIEAVLSKRVKRNDIDSLEKRILELQTMIMSSGEDFCNDDATNPSTTTRTVTSAISRKKQNLLGKYEFERHSRRARALYENVRWERVVKMKCSMPRVK
ncbi:unnamed protein product [Amoebophrya sp. A120]|nr:unnamed protein product [Amoebophrya sp. A120]|eukprot:GSA120T00022258001.1